MYTANLVVNSPIMAGVFRCKDCHMNFQTQQLLTKHKTKFCVGSASDPDDLQLRRGLRSTSPQRIISPDDKDDYRRNPNSDQQLRSLAENHGRQMEYLQLQNRDLEKQREEIRRRLENLGRRTVVPPQDNSADLLRELRDQEHRNQRALDDLKNQLMMMNREPKTQIIEVEKPVFPPQPPPPPPPPPEEPRRPIVLPVYYGKSLVAEINAIRQAYLQNGGNDPEVLSQMAQMQAEAQAIEDQMNQKPEKPREKPKDNNQTFNLLEMENERLIQELRLLQEQNTLARNRRNSDKEGKKHTYAPTHSHTRHPKSYKPQYNPPPPLPSHKYPSKPVQNRPIIARRADVYQHESLSDREGLRQPEVTFKPFLYTDRPRPERDQRSYNSEPLRGPKSLVIKYKASHQPDGTIRITRANSFYDTFPNLSLQEFPSDFGDSRSYGKENHQPVNNKKPPQYPSRRNSLKDSLSGYKALKPINPSAGLQAKSKLSHVTEVEEAGLASSRFANPQDSQSAKKASSPEKLRSRQPSLNGSQPGSFHGSHIGSHHSSGNPFAQPLPQQQYSEGQFLDPSHHSAGAPVYAKEEDPVFATDTTVTREPSHGSVKYPAPAGVPSLDLPAEDSDTDAELARVGGQDYDEQGQDDFVPEGQGHQGYGGYDNSESPRDLAWQVTRQTEPMGGIFTNPPSYEQSAQHVQ